MHRIFLRILNPTLGIPMKLAIRQLPVHPLALQISQPDGHGNGTHNIILLRMVSNELSMIVCYCVHLPEMKLICGCNIATSN